MAVVVFSNIQSIRDSPLIALNTNTIMKTNIEINVKRIINVI